MFTTLCLMNSKRLFPKFVSEILEYKGFTYYATRLYSKNKANEKIIKKFEKRAELPVISEDSPIVKRYKMLLLANSVLVKPFKNIGILDKEGQLSFLLPLICEKCGSISVFCENTAADAVENEILECFGTPIIRCERPSAVLKSDVVFAAEEPPIFKGPNVFTLENTLNKTVVPPFSLPDYADKFSALAGLYYYGGFKELGKLKLTEEAAKPLHL